MRIKTKGIDNSEILNALQSIYLRVEKQSKAVNSLDNFVPILDFASLSTPNTNIIFGRNGTGKTHLLTAFSQYSVTRFEKNKVLPIYIDCSLLGLGPVFPEISADDLLLRFYRLFHRKLVDELKHFSEKAITVTLLDKLFNGEGNRRKTKIEESIKRINGLLNEKQIEERVKEYVRKIEKEKEGSSKLGAQIGISGKGTLTGPETKYEAGIQASAEDVKREKEKVEIIYRGLAVIDYEAIRREFEQIIEQCGAVAIILLVDEWSSISLNVQPLFAEMIRKTLAVSKSIFLKIVALKYLTRLSAVIEPPQRIGFQTGIDASVSADLDSLLNYDLHPQGVKDFLTVVAYKHACISLEKLKKWSIVQFEEYITNQLFNNVDTYLEVVRSSEGNPRDFLAILSSLSAVQSLHEGNKITLQQVIHVAAQHFEANKTPELQDNQSALELFNNIFQRVIKNQNKLFLVSVNLAMENFLLQELWHYRFIHILNPSFLLVDDDGKPHEFVVYSLDYGKLISLKISERGRNIMNKMNKTADFAISIFGGVFTIGIINIFRKLFEDEKLSRLIGRYSVAKEGVEGGSLENTEELIKNAVIDSLLLSKYNFSYTKNSK